MQSSPGNRLKRTEWPAEHNNGAALAKHSSRGDDVIITREQA
ncbi:hypothetical protein [Limosilactobacillus equigenerosi]|nr:hypothetical protein [Limosilactobacillus equigenerosi]